MEVDQANDPDLALAIKISQEEALSFVRQKSKEQKQLVAIDKKQPEEEKKAAAVQPAPQ